MPAPPHHQHHLPIPCTAVPTTPGLSRRSLSSTHTLAPCGPLRTDTPQDAMHDRPAHMSALNDDLWPNWPWPHTPCTGRAQTPPDNPGQSQASGEAPLLTARHAPPRRSVPNPQPPPRNRGNPTRSNAPGALRCVACTAVRQGPIHSAPSLRPPGRTVLRYAPCSPIPCSPIVAETQLTWLTGRTLPRTWPVATCSLMPTLLTRCPPP